MENHPNIRNIERLTSIFGCWPSFHDAEVVWLRFDRNATPLGEGPTAEALIHVFTITNEVRAEGNYVLQNHVLVHLRFARIMELKVDGFNHQNALFGLSIKDITPRQMEQLNFEVGFDPSWGVGANFQCQSIEVVNVEACDRDGLPIH